MSLGLLFALAIAGFLASWILWLIAISRRWRPGIIGGALAFVAGAGALVAINEQRLDERNDEFGEQVRTYIGLVAEAQQEAFRRSGTYREELPDVPDEVLIYDGGKLAEDRELEPALSATEDGYTIEAELGDESYALSVERAGGEVVEARTCEATGPGCENGSWEP